MEARNISQLCLLGSAEMTLDFQPDDWWYNWTGITSGWSDYQDMNISDSSNESALFRSTTNSMINFTAIINFTTITTNCMPNAS